MQRWIDTPFTYSLWPAPAFAVSAPIVVSVCGTVDGGKIECGVASVVSSCSCAVRQGRESGSVPFRSGDLGLLFGRFFRLLLLLQL